MQAHNLAPLFLVQFNVYPAQECGYGHPVILEKQGRATGAPDGASSS